MHGGDFLTDRLRTTPASDHAFPATPYAEPQPEPAPPVLLPGPTASPLRRDARFAPDPVLVARAALHPARAEERSGRLWRACRVIRARRERREEHRAEGAAADDLSAGGRGVCWLRLLVPFFVLL